MTNHEAIQFLKNMQGEENGRAIGAEGFYAELCGYHVQALGIAIKALKQKSKTGRWISVGSYFWKCSECKCCEIIKSDWCPNCGASMQEVEK